MSSPLLRSSLAGIAGLVGYGAWAAYVNWDYGSTIAIRSGIVQGTYSLVLTFAMTLVTEWLHAKLAHVPHGGVVTMLAVCVILFSSAYLIHVIVGTPEILMTILPGFLIGTAYTSVYILGLRRAVTLRHEAR